MNFRLPKGFLLGVASAAAQVEGGDTDSSWNDWYRKGRIKDGSDPAESDHWARWEEDTGIMASMGIQICRFGVEWSRLFPCPGQPDEKAIEHYRCEIEAMLAHGIRPLFTIHHFSNPTWFENMGGFSRRKNLSHFLDLVKLVTERFGDLVSDYITINEPNVFATNGYLWGQWPPGEKSYTKTFTVLSNLCWCHIKAYGMIHRIRSDMGYSDTMVGFANHVRVFDPKNPRNPWHRFCAKLTEYAFQGALTRAMSLGEFRFPLRNAGKLPRGEYSDFNGVNYYTRSTVSGIADGVRANSPRNDLDWEIYPEGIVRCGKALTKVLNRPLWITENGTCDNDDRFRSRYLYEHLKAISESDLPFERYYHWCFCDNFEWVEGNSARFGLVHVDYTDGRKRTVKDSGRFYAAVIAEGGVTQPLYDEFIKDRSYDIR